MSPAGEGGLAVLRVGEDVLVVAQAGEGGLSPLVMFGLVAVISFLAFRWVFRRRSRQQRAHEDEHGTKHDDGEPEPGNDE